MKRREALAGLGALGALGAGGAVAFGTLGNSEGDHIEPVEVPRIDAPGSPPGTETVPETGRVTYLSLFATWCTICQDKMEPLGEAKATVDGDVQFVSATYEQVGLTLSRADVSEWWVDHDGAWPVVHDDNYALTTQLNTQGVPHSLVLDADNRVTWSESGYKSADTLVEHIRQG